ncbi:multidrug efflux system membrane fusion protein [Rhodanobacter sp. ANJX3]|uniref:multidrug transporter subunit MdtN n=1 Tax=Rhodanobacter sp. ANJX3 TaxID=2723083 RepID=UPI00185B662D|nr:multidrug transporter subunit MdtN [Rhodanobacter sp. ANJX3]MBB5357095.1 multidrug efflux system membrane fusion protein [Rhodanobacter sp. ANJX3]
MTMMTAGTRHHASWAKLISLAIIMVAALFGLYTLHQHSIKPSTDDATIDADVVHVASVVGGRVIDIQVAENSRVAKGDLLFQIDPVPYRLAVQQAQADLNIARAALATQQRVLSTQRSAATIATEQVRRAMINLNLATRTVVRISPLAAKGYVPTQQLDQALTAQHDAATSLEQAREQQAAATQAVDTKAGAEATVQARQAALAIAQRGLEDTTVRASHAGRVVGLSVLTGEIIAPSQSLFTLVNDDEWFAVANFREIDLRAIAVGDCATAFSMIDRARPIKGVVQGIGSGVLDTDRINLPRSVPYVERSLNWVKVAQRFPVRIRLEDPPQGLMRLGATAVVEVNHGAACK